MNFKYCLCIFIIFKEPGKPSNAPFQTSPSRDAVSIGSKRSSWRRIQDLWLASTYMKREATHRYIKQLMALPFLLLDDIPSAFHILTTRANTAELRALEDFMDHQWIRNPPSAWYVCRLPVRTNNDVEGNSTHFKFVILKILIPFQCKQNVIPFISDLLYYFRLASPYQRKSQTSLL